MRRLIRPLVICPVILCLFVTVHAFATPPKPVKRPAYAVSTRWDGERAELRVQPNYPDHLREVWILGVHAFDRGYVELDTRAIFIEFDEARHRLRRATVKTDQGTYDGAGQFPNFVIESVRGEHRLSKSRACWVIALVREDQLYVSQTELGDAEIVELSPKSFPDELSGIPGPVVFITDNETYEALSERQKAVMNLYARLGKVHLMGRKARPITGYEHMIGIDNSPENLHSLTAALEPVTESHPPLPLDRIGAFESYEQRKEAGADSARPVKPFIFLIAGAAYLVFTLIYLVRRLRLKKADIRLAYLLPVVALATSIVVYLADMAATRMEGESIWSTLTVHHLPDRSLSFDAFHIIGRSTQVISIEGPHFEIIRQGSYDHGGSATPKFRWLSTPRGDRMEGFKVARLSDRRLRMMRLEPAPAPLTAVMASGRLVMESRAAWVGGMPLALWDTRRCLKLKRSIHVTSGRVEIDLDLEHDEWIDIDEPIPYAVELLAHISPYMIVLETDPGATSLRVSGVARSLRHRAVTAIPVTMR